MRRKGHDWILRRRLARQRLTSSPAPTAAQVVRELLAVQAQDAPLAAWSLGLRVRDATLATVRAEQATGAFVRTHVLRPTWHFVAAEDLRWLLMLTAPRIERGLAGRHRQLGLDRRALHRGLDTLTVLLDRPGGLTRRELRAHADARRLPEPGPALGHLLLVAELRGLICGGPPRGAEHTYRLLDDAIAPTGVVDGDEALARLVKRFFAGHGPAHIGDLTRWARVTVAEVQRGLDIVGGELERVEIAGRELWSARSVPRATRDERAWLIPVFDEVFLTYRRETFARVAGHPMGDRVHRFAEAGGGVVICDLAEVGTWRRTVDRSVVRIRLDVARGLPVAARAAVERAADRLARFIGRPRA